MTEELDGYVPMMEAVGMIGNALFSEVLIGLHFSEVESFDPGQIARELLLVACWRGELTGAYRVGDPENERLYDPSYQRLGRLVSESLGSDIYTDELPLDVAIEYRSVPREEIPFEFFIRRAELEDYVTLLICLPRSLKDLISIWPSPEAWNSRHQLARKRGPRGGKVEKTAQKMTDDVDAGKLTFPQLASMLEKTMEARYGVSRDTARKARNQVLPSWVKPKPTGSGS